MKTKLLIPVIALVLVGILVWSSGKGPAENGQTGTQTGTKDPGDCDSAATPEFCGLQKAIGRLGQAEYDPLAYKRIENNIAGFNALDATQRKILNDYLNTSYLGVLARTIDRFCTTASQADMGQAGNFENELRMLEVARGSLELKNNLLVMLGSLKQAFVVYKKIQDYARTRQYDAASFFELQHQLSALASKAALEKNSNVQELVAASAGIREALATLETSYEGLKEAEKNNDIERLKNGQGNEAFYSINSGGGPFSNSFYKNEFNRIVNP